VQNASTEWSGDVLSVVDSETLSSLPLTSSQTSEATIRLNDVVDVQVFSHSYRVVITIDVSPSMFNVDTLSHCIFYERVCSALEHILCALVTPIRLARTRIFRPRLYVTVLVQGALLDTLHVLVQGWLLTLDSLHILLPHLRHLLHAIETRIVKRQTGSRGYISLLLCMCVYVRSHQKRRSFSSH
jgi:hypothetical protein